MSTLLFLVLSIIAYLLGSVCSAVIVCKLFSLPDPRVTGSRNPGATNVLRIAGKKYAAIVLFFDLLKGLIPVLIAKVLGAGPATLGFVCFFAVMGHSFPIFFNFQGGKGVATAIGAYIGLNWFLGLLVVAVWCVIANFTRYASLASIIAVTTAPFFSLFLINGVFISAPLFFITLFVIFKHRENITRLIDGEEPKIELAHNLGEELTAIFDEEDKEEALEEEIGKDHVESADLSTKEEQIVAAHKLLKRKKQTHKEKK